jgi:hypothetical protein
LIIFLRSIHSLIILEKNKRSLHFIKQDIQYKFIIFQFYNFYGRVLFFIKDNFSSFSFKKEVPLNELTAASSLSFLVFFISLLNSVSTLVKHSTCVFKSYSFSGIFILATPFSKKLFCI